MTDFMALLLWLMGYPPVDANVPKDPRTMSLESGGIPTTPPPPPPPGG